MVTAAQAPEETLEQQIGRIAGIISSERFPTEERATLRRMNPDRPLPLSFYRFAFSYLPTGWEYAVDDWTTLVAGIALMSPGAHKAQVGFGRALGRRGIRSIGWNVFWRPKIRSGGLCSFEQSDSWRQNRKHSTGLKEHVSC